MARKRKRKGRVKIKDVLAAKLAQIGPTATAIERLAMKIEVVVDAFIEAEEIPIRLRRRDDDVGDNALDSMVERIIDRILDSVEAVVEIPFQDEEDDDHG